MFKTLVAVVMAAAGVAAVSALVMNLLKKNASAAKTEIAPDTNTFRIPIEDDDSFDDEMPSGTPDPAPADSDGPSASKITEE